MHSLLESGCALEFVQQELAMQKRGHDGMYTLRLEEGGAPVEVGSFVMDFRGDGGKLEGGTAPQKPSSNGKVQVDGREFYASVWGLVWTKD